jgi:hypothetical protein
LEHYLGDVSADMAVRSVDRAATASRADTDQVMEAFDVDDAALARGPVDLLVKGCHLPACLARQVYPGAEDLLAVSRDMLARPGDDLDGIQTPFHDHLTRTSIVVSASGR